MSKEKDGMSSKPKYNICKAAVADLYLNKGHTATEIAEMLGTTRAAIKSKVRHLKTSFSSKELQARRYRGYLRNKIKPEPEHIRKLLKENRTLSMVCEITGYDIRSLGKFCKENNIPYNTEKGRMRRSGWEMVAEGYAYQYRPDLKSGSKTGIIGSHRAIVADYIGRPLTVNEVVHHIDYMPLNNSIKNLALLTRQQHRMLHFYIERFGAYKLGLTKEPPTKLKYDEPILYGGEWITEIIFNKVA